LLFSLTGQDDSQIVTVESKEERNARLAVEEATISEILAERHSELQALSVNAEEIKELTERLEKAIDDASRLVVTTREEIADLERRRTELYDESVHIRSRLIFLPRQQNLWVRSGSGRRPRL
jgi:hypothetical protein